MIHYESSALGEPPAVRELSMSQKHSDPEDDLLPEYDFTGAVRGKYWERYRQGSNVVLLDPDVATVFQDAAAVNDALRLLVSLAEAKATRKPIAANKQERPAAAPRTRQKATRP